MTDDAARATVRQPEILIIDDDLDQLNLIKKLLANAGFLLRLANSGEVGLLSAAEQCPDLVLLDVQMPVLDGYEVCRRLKASPATKDLPVIFLSALDDVKDKIKGFEAGGIDYITKPYETMEVMERIKTHLKIFYMQQQLSADKWLLEEQIKNRERDSQNPLGGSEIFQNVFLSLGDGIICTDIKGKIILINEIAKNLTGWYGESAYGANFEDVCCLVDFHSRERIENPLVSVIGTGLVYHLPKRVCLLSREGIERYISDSIAPIKGGDGRTIGCVMVFRDNTEDKIRKQELEHLIYDDFLTGIKNRRYFDEELIRLNAQKYLPLGLIIGDINGLKTANDAYGHLEGDGLLVRTAQLLEKNRSMNDVVCRYGGDEFVILMPQSSQDKIESFIRDVHSAVEESRGSNDLLSISFGYAIKDALEEDILDILKKAENNLYRNKLSENPSVRHSLIETILRTLYEKSPREEAHSTRVSKLVGGLAAAMGEKSSEISEMKTAGLLHDIGKTIIPDTVLNKPDRLSVSEWTEMKRHPEIGYRILRNNSALGDLALAILEHHERWDGSGYPKGLSHDEISMSARMIAVADTFDALTSERPYKIKTGFSDALAIIKKGSGVLFDPAVVDAFISMVNDFEESSPPG